ncbi:MAG: hypothetical protein DI539_22850, partial [Flavobacterium psychrophilum]
IASAKVAPFSTSANFKQPFFYFILTFLYNSLICYVLDTKVFSMFFFILAADLKIMQKSSSF